MSWTAPDNVVGTLPQVSAALSIGTQPPQLIPIDLSAAIQQAAQRELDAVIAREEELAEQGESSEADIPQRPHGWLDQAQYAVWVWLRDHQPECTLMLEDTIDWGVQWSVNSVNVRVATGILRLFAVQNELLRWIVKQAAKKYGDDAILLVLNQVAPQLLQDFLNALAALRSATAGTVCAVARDVIRPTAT